MPGLTSLRGTPSRGQAGFPDYDIGLRLLLAGGHAGRYPAHQTAFFFGRPRFNLAGRQFFWRTGVWSQATANFFFGGREFLGADREFFGQGPRIFCHQLRRQSALFFLGGRVFFAFAFTRARHSSSSEKLGATARNAATDQQKQPNEQQEQHKQQN